MIDTQAVPPSPGLATTSTTNTNSRSGCQEHLPTHSSLPSSTSVAHPSPTFPAHIAPPPSVRSTTATPSATDQSSPSSSFDAISPPSHNTSPTATSSAVAVRMDASPVILFTLQYSVAVVQGVTIYILSVVFSILQLVSGQLNDGSPPSSSSGSSAGSSAVSASRKRSEDEERRQQRQQQRRRRRRWSGDGINSATGTGTTTFSSTLTAETSTSVRGWAQNLIIGHTQSQSNPVEGSANAAGGGATPTPGGGEGGAGTLAQRVEVLRFLGSTIASLVGSYARPTSSTAFSSASGEGAVESKTNIKRQLSSSLSKASGAAEAGEMNYSSRIRRALVKTLSGHAIPLPRSIKRVTFNDTLQFHTTTTNRRPRARFGDEDEDKEEDEDEDEDEADSTSSSPVLRFFSAGFSGTSELALSPKAPMSTSLSPSTPLPVPGGGSWKKEKKNRPPSIMPSARDRLQLQDQDDLEDLAAATLQQQDVRPGGVFNVVSNGRSIPVSTTTMTPGASTMGKKLASTITIALPPLSRPRKQQPLAPQQQQQQAQMPVSPMFSITATSTSSAAATTTSTATTTTTTTTTSMTMTVPTSYTPLSGTSGLASALLSSLMMPAAPGPISDAARSLLTSTSTSTPTSAPPTVDAFAPALSDSDSSKGPTGRGGHLKRTRSAPSKISTFLQQHRLTRQQQQQSGQMQGQGLFSPGEYTSPRDLVSLPKSVLLPATAGFAKSTATSTTTASTASTTETQISSCTTTAPTIDVNVRARQPSVSSTSSSSTTTLIRPRSLHSIQSTVSSAVAAVIIGTGVPPPSVPTSLTTSMSRSLSPSRVGPATIAATTTMVTAFSPTHQRRRSASIDLGMSTPNLSTSYSSPKEETSTPGADSVVDITPTGSGGRSLMYKLTHPQRYKRELELQLQSQSQKDTSSLSSASSSPSASQVALSPLSPTFSPTSSTTSSIQGTLRPESSSSSSAAKVVYPFSRSFTDLPPSLSYLSDDPHPVHLPPPHTYTPASVAASVSVDNSLSPSSSTTNVATFEEIYQPQPLLLNTPLPAIGDKEGIPAAVRESTTPPLSMFFPSPTSQHRAPLPSPTLALSSMKDTLAQLRRSPSPRLRRSVVEDEDGASNAHTTFAACGFSISSSSS